MSEKTYRYRADVPQRVLISPIAREVEPGEEFDSPEPLNHPHLTLLQPEPKGRKSKE